MGLWEDVTDRETLAELLPGSARHLSSGPPIASAERGGNDLTGAEPGQISLKTPGVMMYQTWGAAASLLTPL